MANFEIPEEVVFNKQVRKYQIDDPAHADLFNDVTEKLLHNDVFLKRMAERLQEATMRHEQDHDNPHGVTSGQLGIEEGANNYMHPDTHPADIIIQDASHRFVTDAQTQAWDDTYGQAAGYTDQKIADLIGGAPETLDTLKEIADAMAANADVVEALDAAVGLKASKAELDSHTGNSTVHITASERTSWNGKMEKTGDSAENTATFTNDDAANPSGWTNVAVMASGEKHKTLLNKLSTMAKNVRWLYKLLGTTNISSIGNGTVTGAISTLNTGLAGKANTLTDTTWQTLPLVNGVKAYSANHTPIYRKYGKIVEISGAVLGMPGMNTSGGLHFATLPNGYKPSIYSYTVCQGSGTNKWLLTLQSDGIMLASRYGTSGNASSMAGTEWIAIHAIFLTA